MKLVIVSCPQFFVEEDKIITTLFEEGLDMLHIYKPGSEPLYFERLLTLIPEEYHKNIVIHEHYYMKHEFDLGGIHLDNPHDDIPSGYRGKVSRSCTDIQTLRDVKRGSEYVFLHDIFDSLHEPGVKSKFTAAEIHEASRRGLIDKHVYALGGMCADNIRWAQDEGFGGVVICGDLWNRFNIHQQTDYKDLISHFQRLRKIVR
ncbi:MAG: thiamine phosphate synthase [Prevotella sp.]